MAASAQTTLPATVLAAVEELVKASERYGWACAQRDKGATATKAVEYEFTRMQTMRRALTDAIEAHSLTMYNGGIEMGIAQAEAQKR